MKLETLCEKLPVKLIIGNPKIDFCGVYAGDFVSRVVSREVAGKLWITVMNNINVIAAASLAGMPAVLIAEDVVFFKDALEAAEKYNIAVLSSKLGEYELCAGISRIFSEGT